MRQNSQKEEKTKQQIKKLPEMIRISLCCIDEEKRKIYNFTRCVFQKFSFRRFREYIKQAGIRRKDLMRGMDKIEKRNDQVQKFYDF